MWVSSLGILFLDPPEDLCSLEEISPSLAVTACNHEEKEKGNVAHGLRKTESRQEKGVLCGPAYTPLAGTCIH
jgi:hypothetical protein